jgi:hypothetical protein
VEKAVGEKGEKRRIERYELAAPARIVLEGATEPTVIDLYTKDISAGGAYFRTDQQVPEGAHVKLEVTITVGRLKELTGVDSTFRLKVNGIVVRSADGGIAIRFDSNYQMVPTTK